MLYTIGEMANLLKVAPSTLRYYEKEGLLPYIERSSGGIRMFSGEDFERLSVISCLKKTGMSIKDIKTFIEWCMEGDDTIEQRLDLIVRQREEVLTQMAQMQETLDFLNYKRWYYESAKQAGTCQVHDSMELTDIPKELRGAFEKAKSTPLKCDI